VSVNIIGAYSDQLSDSPQIKYSTFQYTSDSTYLFAQLPGRLLRASGDSSSLLIEYKVRPSYKSDKVINRGSIQRFFSDTLHPEALITVRQSVYVPEGRKYVLTADYFPRDGSGIKTRYLELDRTNANQPDYYSVRKVSDGLPLFADYVSGDESVRIEHSDSEIGQLWIRYYEAEFPPAPPPFEEEYRFPRFFYLPWDSQYTYPVGEPLQMPETGIYHVLKDTTQKYGRTLYRFSSDYPRVTTTEALTKPMRYITTQKEYARLLDAPDRKAKADSGGRDTDTSIRD
jgi:hypothetical protein